MKAVLAKGAAGIDALALRDLPTPLPGPGQVLVRLKIAAINYRDLLFITGRLSGYTKEPEYIPLCSAAGEVVAIAPDVQRVKIRDRVTPTYCQGWIEGDKPSVSVMVGAQVDGVACEYAVFAEDDLCLVPDEPGDMKRRRCRAPA